MGLAEQQFQSCVQINTPGKRWDVPEQSECPVSEGFVLLSVSAMRDADIEALTLFLWFIFC